MYRNTNVLQLVPVCGLLSGPRYRYYSSIYQYRSYFVFVNARKHLSISHSIKIDLLEVTPSLPSGTWYQYEVLGWTYYQVPVCRMNPTRIRTPFGWCFCKIRIAICLYPNANTFYSFFVNLAGCAMFQQPMIALRIYRNMHRSHVKSIDSKKSHPTLQAKNITILYSSSIT